MFFLIALAITGLFLLFLEFFLPGAIMAIGGSLLLLSSLFVYYMTYPMDSFFLLYCFGLAISVYLVIKLGIRQIRSSKKTMYLDTDQEGYQACLYPKELIGKTGMALNDLRPSGHIRIEEKTFQALAKTGFIEKGTSILVIGGQGSHLIVQPSKS
ncbi:MAG TPA: serine protease [Parachlamydiales bacterium]|nr:serine protease [Parachlamydiales bacterium]